ncbi:MAG: RES family NAD+ phosphorylase [Pyrinomonadaceae bacterium]|nr:RES family NAD+ phosphorylase [Pyrinomonadaceae bacterium]
MEAFRLSREKYAAPLSGKGAAIKGARWNSVGVELIYTAANRSLAMAEVAVHLTLATVPGDYVMLTIYLPDNISTQKLTEADLPIDWNSFPHPASTQTVGDKFVADNKYCVLQIPSAVTRGDFNLLINPRHLESPKIKIIAIEKFPFDKRIFK